MESDPARTDVQTSQNTNESTAVLLPTSFDRRKAKTATPEERLACAVAALRDSVWNDILHISRCWRVTPQDLLDASRKYR